MQTHRLVFLALLAGFGLLILSAPAQAQTVPAPAALKGTIITNSQPIDVPSAAAGFLKKMKKQDRASFKKDEEGKWTIHFVAFFRMSSPVEQVGVVVLDAKNEPVAVADVPVEKGQKTLASQIVVDTTESPGKKHVLQVYYAKGKKPIVLAKKEVVLK